MKSALEIFWEIILAIVGAAAFAGLIAAAAFLAAGCLIFGAGCLLLNWRRRRWRGKDRA